VERAARSFVSLRADAGGPLDGDAAHLVVRRRRAGSWDACCVRGATATVFPRFPTRDEAKRAALAFALRSLPEVREQVVALLAELGYEPRDGHAHPALWVVRARRR
jgi:hypothetical protein